MRYNEIINELSIPDRQSAKNLLITHGYKELGKGAFASVFYKEGAPYVLKLFSKDDGFEAFVELVKRHPNVHFPKYFGDIIELFPDKKSMRKAYYAIKMEKLTPIDDSFELERKIYYLKLYVKYSSEEEDSWPRGLLSDIHKAIVYVNGEESLQEACEILKKISKNLYIDIEPWNVMYRGDTLVIIDPFV